MPGERAAQKSDGYYNPYWHLSKCFAGSNNSFLLMKYQKLSKALETII